MSNLWLLGPVVMITGFMAGILIAVFDIASSLSRIANTLEKQGES